MTSQEKAFICDLIKKNYRRRMFWYFSNLAAIIASAVGSYYANAEELIGLLFLLIAVTLCGIYVRNYLVDSGESSQLPWKIRMAQNKAFEQFQNADFAEMESSVVLKEYFEV